MLKLGTVMEIPSDGLANSILDNKIVYSVLVKGWVNQVSHLNTRGYFQIPELLLHLQ